MSDIIKKVFCWDRKSDNNLLRLWRKNSSSRVVSEVFSLEYSNAPTQLEILDRVVLLATASEKDRKNDQRR